MDTITNFENAIKETVEQLKSDEYHEIDYGGIIPVLMLVDEVDPLLKMGVDRDLGEGTFDRLRSMALSVSDNLEKLQELMGAENLMVAVTSKIDEIAKMVVYGNGDHKLEKETYEKIMSSKLLDPDKLLEVADSSIRNPAGEKELIN